MTSNGVEFGESMSSSDEEMVLLFKEGETICNGRYIIGERLGEGTYATVHLASDTKNKASWLAIKLDKGSGNGFQKEISALKLLGNKMPYATKMVHHETLSGNKGSILVMELLGASVSSEIRRRRQLQRETERSIRKGSVENEDFEDIFPSEILGWCLQMFERIRELHTFGIVHRDIKPSNFLFGLPNTDEEKKIHVVDFGLSKIYRKKDGSIRPARKNAGFRGCSKYASIFSHKLEDLGRRDDLWSFYYMTIDLLTDTKLPWSDLCFNKEGSEKVRSKSKITKMKDLFFTYPAQLLVPLALRCIDADDVVSDDSDDDSDGREKERKRGSSPLVLSKTTLHHLLNFAVHIKSLKYEDEPDYSDLRRMLEVMISTQKECEGKYVERRAKKMESRRLRRANRNDRKRSRADAKEDRSDNDVVSSNSKIAKRSKVDGSGTEEKSDKDAAVGLDKTAIAEKFVSEADVAIDSADIPSMKRLLRDAESKYESFLSFDIADDLLDKCFAAVDKLEVEVQKFPDLPDLRMKGD